MTLGQGHETVTIHPRRGGVDDYGYPLPVGTPLEVRGCIVQPTVMAQDSGRDRTGQVLEWRVIAPAGTVVEDKDTVMIRGRRFTVTAEAFDYSIHRRPALAAHRPRVEFIAKRGEG